MIKGKVCVRISKYIAHSGYCSRRSAEQLVVAGKVTVDCVVVRDLSMKIINDMQVKIDNLAISIPKTEIWIYHKQARTITSRFDDKGRETVFDKLPLKLKNFITIGRLDYNSEGLLLLTNNGNLARFMELPANNLQREYLVRTFGRADFDQMASQLRSGIEISGVRYKPILMSIEKQQGINTWIKFILEEGKNREVRNIISHFNLALSRLIRIRYGKFSLDNLTSNEVVKVPDSLVEYYLEKL